MQKDKYFSRNMFFWLSAALLFVVIFNLAGCASPKYVHTVFFTLKPGTPDAEINGLVDDSCKLLTKVPSVRKIESGRRDINAAREVNDKDFQVGLVVYFDDKTGYDQYEVHPLHQELVKKYKAKIKSVRVCDFITK